MGGSGARALLLGARGTDSEGAPRARCSFGQEQQRRSLLSARLLTRAKRKRLMGYRVTRKWREPRRWPRSPLRKPLAPQSILFASERVPRRVVRVSACSALWPGLLAAGPAQNKLTPNRLARAHFANRFAQPSWSWQASTSARAASGGSPGVGCRPAPLLDKRPDCAPRGRLPPFLPCERAVSQRAAPANVTLEASRKSPAGA